MGGCCYLVGAIVIIVVILAFGASILTLLGIILNVLYFYFLSVVLTTRRISWSKKLKDLSYPELKTELKEWTHILFEAEKKNAMDKTQVTLKNDATLDDAKARVKILKELTKEGDNLKLVQRQKELANFTQTSDYEIVKRFAEKFRDSYTKEDLTQLLKLFESKGHPLDLSELKILVAKEQTNLRIEEAKSNILASNPQNKKEVLRSYLQTYQPKDIELTALEIVLKEKKLFDGSSAELRKELNAVIEEIKTEQFEKGLLE